MTEHWLFARFVKGGLAQQSASLQLLPPSTRAVPWHDPADGLGAVLHRAQRPPGLPLTEKGQPALVTSPSRRMKKLPCPNVVREPRHECRG